MEKLRIQIIVFHRMLLTLEKALIFLQKAKKLNDEEIFLAAEDSLVQRFEYVFDSFWKIIKKYLELKFHVQDANSPKSCFRSGVEHGLYETQVGEIFIKMANDRNITTHTYDIDDVRMIVPNISEYYQHIEAFVKQIETEVH